MNVTDLKLKIIPLVEKYNLKLVVLFGSQASGRTHKQSDLDIAILSSSEMSFDDEFLLSDGISSISGFKEVDVVNLKTASPSLLKSAIYGGKVIYEKYPGLFSLQRMRAFKIFIEAAPLRILRDKRILESIQKLQV